MSLGDPACAGGVSLFHGHSNSLDSDAPVDDASDPDDRLLVGPLTHIAALVETVPTMQDAGAPAVIFQS